VQTASPSSLQELTKLLYTFSLEGSTFVALPPTPRTVPLTQGDSNPIKVFQETHVQLAFSLWNQAGTAPVSI
jgi:hypothetical protein